jgi:drug/metabolite transporter (DMT)-like permease
MRATALVVGLALLWGSGFFWIALALDGFSPVQLTFARLALGAALLAVIVTLRRLHWPTGRPMWTHLTVAALVSNAIPYGLFAFAEQTVPSSLAGALNATTPLWTAVIAYAARGDQPLTPRRLLGLAVGLLGAVIVLAPWNIDSAGAAGGVAACVAAAASYGVSYVYQARYLTNRGHSPLVLAAAQLLAATLLLAAAMPFAGLQPVRFDTTAVAAVLILGLLGTGVAYVLNFAIIAREGPTAASVVTYLVPAVAVVLGIIVLSEPARWTLGGGLALVLLGVALVRRPAHRATIAEKR